MTVSTLSKDLQIRINELVSRHMEELRGNGINNAAVLVADVETGGVLAYVGNAGRKDAGKDENASV